MVRRILIMSLFGTSPAIWFLMICLPLVGIMAGCKGSEVEPDEELKARVEAL
jgi:hypothetical protein